VKLKIKSSLSPAIVRGKHNDTIVAGTIFEVNGKPWTHTYLQLNGHITFDQIEWLSGVTIETKSTLKEWKVKSSRAGKFYTVRETPSGKRTCDCDGFHYRRQCRHINEVK
jgi:Mn-containing catalase